MIFDIRASADNEFGVVQTYKRTHYHTRVVVHLVGVINQTGSLVAPSVWKEHRFLDAKTELTGLYEGGLSEGIQRYVRAKKPFYSKLTGLLASFRVVVEEGVILSATSKFYQPGSSIVEGKVVCKEVQPTAALLDAVAPTYRMLADSAGDREAFLNLQLSA